MNRIALAAVALSLLSAPALAGPSCGDPSKDLTTLAAIAAHPHEGYYWRTSKLSARAAAAVIADYEKTAVPKGETPLSIKPDAVYLSKLYAGGNFVGTEVLFVRGGCVLLGVRINESHLKTLIGQGV